MIGSFFASDNTCELCRAGYQGSCIHRELVGAIGTQAELARIPLADGTLVATADLPPPELIPSLLAASDVLGTGWFATVAAECSSLATNSSSPTSTSTAVPPRCAVSCLNRSISSGNVRSIPGGSST